jgi:DNA-binding beta-propeller fold protein YncE
MLTSPIDINIKSSLLHLILLPAAVLLQCNSKSSKNAKVPKPRFFKRQSNFFLCDQPGTSCEDGNTASASNIASSGDGSKLFYTDVSNDALGFVDIVGTMTPLGMGTADLGGKPKGVATHGNLAAVAVDTSDDYANPSGVVKLFDVTDMSFVHELAVGGQPEGIAWSDDGKYIVINIEVSC